MNEKASTLTLSTVKENAMKGSLSRATLSKYSIFIIEFPLDAARVDGKSPIF